VTKEQYEREEQPTIPDDLAFRYQKDEYIFHNLQRDGSFHPPTKRKNMRLTQEPEREEDRRNKSNSYPVGLQAIEMAAVGSSR
jgi:hypothetical protein